MNCGTCKNTKPGQLTRRGFQECRLQTKFEFYPSRHTCDQWQAKPQAPAPDKPSTAARDEFIEKRNAQRAAI